MAEFQTLAGTVVGMSSTLPATKDQAGYEALTFTNIGLVESVPDMGKEYDLVTFNELGDRSTKKAKGNYDNGGGDFVYALKKTDVGQGLLESAVDSDNSQSMSFTYQDGRVRYVTGIVLSSRESGGGSSDIIKQTSKVEFDSDFVEVTP